MTTDAPRQRPQVGGALADVDVEAVAAAVNGRAALALDLAVEIGRWLPAPGAGATAARWRALSAVAAGDLTAARVVEAHTDALAILAELAMDTSAAAGCAFDVPAGSTWGVFAAEGGGHHLQARPDGDRWLLTGSKPWGSLAGRLTHALITAHTAGGSRRLFAVELTHPGVHTGETSWVARGLADVPSGVVRLVDCPAMPVGPDGWYLDRAGFAWGGMGVAACWYGGAVAVARRLRAAAGAREPDQIALMHLGAIDAGLSAARTLLTAAAADVDAGRAAGSAGPLLAARVRTVVADVAEDVLRRVGHALGPAPLAMELSHARRVADLELYLRQHHAERDDAALGAQVLRLDEWP